MPGCVDTFGLTNVGLSHERNDDHFLIADLKKTVVVHQTSLSYDDETPLLGSSQAKVFLVADGGSDGRTGDRAGLLAIQSIVQSLQNATHWLSGADDSRERAFLNDMETAFVSSQEKVQLFSGADAVPSLPVTSLTLAYIAWPRLYVIHFGRCSVYLCRNENLHRLTSPQALRPNSEYPDSLEGELPPGTLLAGTVDEESSAEPNTGLSPQIGRYSLLSNDKLLLCTDGLTSVVPDLTIMDCLTQNRSSEETCYELIRLACHNKGTDNTTAVLAQFMDGSEQRARQLAAQLGVREPEAQSRAEAMSESMSPPTVSDLNSTPDF